MKALLCYVIRILPVLLGLRLSVPCSLQEKFCEMRHFIKQDVSNSSGEFCLVLIFLTTLCIRLL